MRARQSHPGFTTISIFNGYHFTSNQILVKESKLGWQLEDSLAGRKIHKLLEEAGIQCYITTNISQSRAYKLIANAASNTLSAIEKKTIGELIADRNLRKIVDGIIKESWSVLKEDYELPTLDSVAQTIYKLLFQVKEHYSSMYQDLISGRKTEIEFLNGLIVRLGLEKGVPTPYNQQIYFRLLDETKNV